MKLRLNSDIYYNGKTYKKGSSIYVETDNNGNILDNFWRRRLKEAEIDNFLSIAAEKDSSKDNFSNKKNKK